MDICLRCEKERTYGGAYLCEHCRVAGDPNG